MEYRIVEKDKFYVQRKSFFGWHYRYDENKGGGFGFIVILCLIIFNIAFFANLNTIIKDNKLNIFIICELLMIISFLISRFGYKHKFRSLSEAKSFIDNEILNKESEKKKRELRKIKRKNVKYHYMSLKQERKEKLNKLK